MTHTHPVLHAVLLDLLETLVSQDYIWVRIGRWELLDLGDLTADHLILIVIVRILSRF